MLRSTVTGLRYVQPTLSNAVVFTRFNSTLSNTISTVNAVNSEKTNTINEGNNNASSAKNAINELRIQQLQNMDYSGGFFSNKVTSDPVTDAFDFAQQFIVSDKIAGRSVIVTNKGLDRSLSQFNSLVKANRLREINFDQRFFTKPNKKRLAKRVANRKRVFETGIAKLFDVVKDAVRKGY